MKEKLSEIKGALLTGVSYMLPFVIAGGILIALGFAIGGYDIPNSVEEYGNFASTIFWLGKKAFALMVPVLGAYVAYSIADKPGIAVGMVGGALADMQGSGFLGCRYHCRLPCESVKENQSADGIEITAANTDYSNHRGRGNRFDHGIRYWYSAIRINNGFNRYAELSGNRKSCPAGYHPGLYACL